jgi:hypothetical protein
MTAMGGKLPLAPRRCASLDIQLPRKEPSYQNQQQSLPRLATIQLTPKHDGSRADDEQANRPSDDFCKKT